MTEDRLKKIFIAMFQIVTLIVFFNTLFCNRSLFGFNTFTMTAVFLIISGMAWLICRIINKKDMFSSNHIFIISFLILILLQLIIIAMIHTPMGWDVNLLVKAAAGKGLNEGGNSNYFSGNPNNLFLLFVYHFFHIILDKLFNISMTGFWIFLEIVDAIMIDISIFLVWHITKSLYGRLTADKAYLLAVFFFGLSPVVIEAYSDVMSMPFTLLCFFFYLKLPTERGGKKLYTVLMGVSAGVGYIIKPQAIIILIAVFITECLKFCFSRKPGIFINTLVSVLLGVLIIKGWSAYSYYQQHIPLDREKAFVPQHYFMMGLNYKDGKYGTFNFDDYGLTITQSTRRDKERVCTEEAIRRLREYGISGYGKYLYKKLCWINSEGKMNYADVDYYAKFDLEKSNVLKELFYYGGKYFPCYVYFVQGIWLLIQLMTALPLVFIGKRKPDLSWERVTVILTVIGINMFILLFEGSPRYLTLYDGFFILAAMSNHHGENESKLFNVS